MASTPVTEVPARASPAPTERGTPAPQATARLCTPRASVSTCPSVNAGSPSGPGGQPPNASSAGTHQRRSGVGAYIHPHQRRMEARLRGEDRRGVHLLGKLRAEPAAGLRTPSLHVPG